eukprot:scaffold224038_cov55-Attheya_sp.AAC.1
MGYRAQYGVWSVMLGNFPTTEAFEEFEAFLVPAGVMGKLKIDTQATGATTDAANVAFMGTPFLGGGAGPGVDPTL